MKNKKKIIDWADSKGLLIQSNHKNQLIKLYEEAGELSSAILKNNDDEIVDAIGDIGVVMIILSNQLGYDFEKCIDNAYNVIKDRTGKNINGTFIKDEKTI
jgi:NTP pyrophosphatase (non-canonical NTP hydrolase)